MRSSLLAQLSFLCDILAVFANRYRKWCSNILRFLQMQNKGYNYGFIEYEDPASAERAMQTLNGRSIHQNVSQPDILTLQYY